MIQSESVSGFEQLSYEAFRNRFAQVKTNFLEHLVPNQDVRYNTIFVLYQGALYALPRPSLVDRGLCQDWIYRFNFGLNIWEEAG